MATNGGVDWNGLIERALNASIDIITQKVLGPQAPVGAGVTVSTSGVQMYSSSLLLPFAILATLAVGVVLLIKK
jgi:hypothetical protein